MRGAPLIFHSLDRSVPGGVIQGNLMNHLGGNAGDLPTKAGPRWSLPGVGRTPSSAEPQVAPPSAPFHPVSDEFVLGIFPGCLGSDDQILSAMWALESVCCRV